MLHETLKKYFGYESFRGEQEKIIRDLLGGKDVVATMPTGGGKSICYQLPALIFPGLTIVGLECCDFSFDFLDGKPGE